MNNSEPESSSQVNTESTSTGSNSKLGKLGKFAAPLANEKLSPQLLLSSVGGWWGIVESILPSIAFLVGYFLSGQDLLLSLLPSLLIAVVFVAIRLLSKQSASSAFAGFIGIAASAGIAIATGNLENNFVIGLITNAGIFIAFTLSVLLRYPLFGVILGYILELENWRQNKLQYRASVYVTLIWAVVALIRFLLQLPLFLSGEIPALVAVKLAFGLPLYLFSLWASWLLIRSAFRSELS